ncbi:MAG: alpha-1,2-fucosyltransferase [Lachnospiraceae bacterium]|nr:alpha-1,2-fucosyltransferase [Lachnospiraceae bacterium]
MIIVRFTGGLGNQMFQYALYEYLKNKYPEETVKADISWYKWNEAHQGFELKKIFERDENPSFKLDEASEFEIRRLSGKFPQKNEFIRYINRFLRLFGEEKYKRMNIHDDGHGGSGGEIKKRIDSIKAGENAYITGYYLDEGYYRDNLGNLRKAFSFDKKRVSDENRDILKDMADSESVSIHVRHGDYSSPVYNGTFKILGLEYYKKAVDFIRERVDDPRFFIFSDDTEYIKREFEFLDNKRVVTNNTGKDSYLDMMLMSNCKHNITANSTFSEWAGLLNDNPDAMIIYPKEYLKDKDSDIKTIPGWKRI